MTNPAWAVTDPDSIEAEDDFLGDEEVGASAGVGQLTDPDEGDGPGCGQRAPSGDESDAQR